LKFLYTGLRNKYASSKRNPKNTGIFQTKRYNISLPYNYPPLLCNRASFTHYCLDSRITFRSRIILINQLPTSTRGYKTYCALLHGYLLQFEGEQSKPVYTTRVFTLCFKALLKFDLVHKCSNVCKRCSQLSKIREMSPGMGIDSLDYPKLGLNASSPCMFPLF
jgi:hypothetical protein